MFIDARTYLHMDNDLGKRKAIFQSCVYEQL